MGKIELFEWLVRCILWHNIHTHTHTHKHTHMIAVQPSFTLSGKRVKTEIQFLSFWLCLLVVLTGEAYSVRWSWQKQFSLVFCLSVCLSVRASVTRSNCVEIDERDPRCFYNYWLHAPLISIRIPTSNAESESPLLHQSKCIFDKLHYT